MTAFWCDRGQAGNERPGYSFSINMGFPYFCGQLLKGASKI